MLSKSFDKFLITLFCLNAAIAAYHFLTGHQLGDWDVFDHLNRPVTSSDLFLMAIFVVGAIYKSADAIVAAITRRQGVEAVANALI